MKQRGRGTIIVGIDEAGRAPLAGPVVAAACVLECPLYLRRKSWPCWTPFPEPSQGVDCLIADSKKLRAEQREQSYMWLTQNCPYGIGITGALDVDRLGILSATEKAMRSAVEALRSRIRGGERRSFYLLIDGCDAFWFDYPHSSIIRGDQVEPCIAAASIIAKVTRDRWMVRAAKKFLAYGFERHKGYGTRAHFEAISRLGPCPLHRRSFLGQATTTEEPLQV